MLGHRLRAALNRKRLLRLLLNFLFPQANLHRMHAVLLSDLMDRLDPAQRLQSELSLMITRSHRFSAAETAVLNSGSTLPCEGTGYEVGSMSILKGARNMDNAKKFYDWALTVNAQKLGAQALQFQLPSNKNAPQPPEAPRFSNIKLIQYDFKKYGSSTERKRLLEKWEKDVNSLPCG